MSEYNRANYREIQVLEDARAKDDSIVFCLECASGKCLHVQLQKHALKPCKVVESIVKSFPNDYEKVLKALQWDDLNGCYYVAYAGMYVGIEEDGYIHT